MLLLSLSIVNCQLSSRASIITLHHQTAKTTINAVSCVFHKAQKIRKQLDC